MIADAKALPDVDAAQAGDREALERVVRAVEPLVHRLALRFFGCPDHAADATQEVLLQILTHLDRFERRSALSTWVYRVATHKFLSMARSRAERAALSLDQFERDLAAGSDMTGPWHGASAGPSERADPDRELLEAEVRIGCTLAMLLCLERDGRMAYIVGAILELDHRTAAEILGCTTATYRKRLERARATITGLMRRRCGVFDPANACRCAGRIPVAIERGRLDPERLVFATAKEQVRRFPQVLAEISRLQELQRAAAIYQSHPDPGARADFSARLETLLASSVESVASDQSDRG